MGLSEGSTFLDQLMAAFRAGNPEVSAAKSVEAEHVARVQALYSCIARGDFEGLGPLMTDDVELDINAPSMPAIQGTWRGRAEVIAAIERNFAQVGEQAPEVREVVVRGDTVMILARETGHTVADGQPYTLSWIQFFTFRDGLLFQLRENVS